MRQDEDWFCLNLAVACWRKNPDPEQWPGFVASWTGEKPKEASVSVYPTAEGLLLGELKPTADLLDRIAECIGCSADDLLYADASQAYVSSARIHNIRRLIGGWHGTQKELARALGVSQTTVTRWKLGQQEPDSAALRSISQLFQLGGVSELDSPRQFLSFRPVTHAERLSWLRRRIESLGAEESRELFPAFERLLRGRG